jgi:hypothetical protein
MNILRLHIILALAVISVGCVSGGNTVSTGQAGAGWLKVYTPEAWLNARDDSFSHVRTPYQILTTTGRCYQNVCNQLPNASEEPETIRLPAGDYVVVGRRTHEGEVRIPVKVRAGETRVLHLDEANTGKEDARTASAGSWARVF